MNLEQNLNELLSDLNVFYRKLQNYHWNVTGQDFFQAHSKLEELYNEIRYLFNEVRSVSCRSLLSGLSGQSRQSLAADW